MATRLIRTASISIIKMMILTSFSHRKSTKVMCISFATRYITKPIVVRYMILKKRQKVKPIMLLLQPQELNGRNSYDNKDRG